MAHAEHLAQDAIRRTVNSFYHAIEHRDMNALRDVVTNDWQYIASATMPSTGVDEMAAVFESMQRALPDMEIHVLDVLVNDRMVGVRAQVEGTQHGELMGIKPASKPIVFAVHSFHQIRDGLIEKTWHLEDWMDCFRQIGSLPPGIQK
ncbi:ester cyclase [Caballeronia sp. DA-9]|uniref:ester cyclase n=1 Tax=Caballeronia sp. DA-9 TaxID=3436237 RepID=UPI003F665184